MLHFVLGFVGPLVMGVSLLVLYVRGRRAELEVSRLQDLLNTRKSSERKPRLLGAREEDLSDYERGVADGKAIERWESELGLSVTTSGMVRDRKTGRFVPLNKTEKKRKRIAPVESVDSNAEEDDLRAKSDLKHSR